MNHGSLFSGIGGFDLAAEWMGWENIFHCEWNEFGQRVLKHHFPNSISYGDITKTDFNIHRGRIDILSGGFPCQPYSQAGKRLGKEDDRHLWPEMLRAIREIQPSWIVGENVSGLVNWSGGLVFDEVQSDMEAEGYGVLPFLLPACAKNAPHRRDRIWFIAYSDGSEQTNRRRKDSKEKGEIRRNEASDVPRELSSVRDVTNSNVRKRKVRTLNDRMGRAGKQNEENTWSQFPTQHPFCGGDDGLSAELDGITFPKWRNESIKAYGNAIVPQVALEIFKSIERFNQH